MATRIDPELFRGRAAASQGSGGTGGGGVDDTQKRLGIIETAIAEIKVILLGLATKAELEQFRGATNAELEQFRGSTNAEFQKVHGDNREIRATLAHFATGADVEVVRREMEVVRREISELHAAMIKWIIATMMTMSALAFGIAKFVS
jgi:hypothetical protein